MDLIQGAFPFAEGRTARLAAKHVTASGVRQAQQQAAYAAVRTFPGKTSAELARLTGRDRHQLAKRLPECRVAGMVKNPKDDNGNPILRACTKTGRVAMTWEPIVQ